MDPMQQPGQGIPQQPNNGTPNPASLEDFIRQNAGMPQAQSPVQPQAEQVQVQVPQIPVEPQSPAFDQHLFGAGIPSVTPPTTVNTSSDAPQVIEKIVYKKQRVHGFFRTLTIIALVVIGFLMLLQALGIFTLDISGLDFTLIYPIFIIFSSIVIWSYRGIFGKVFGMLLFLAVVGGFFTIGVYTSLNPSTKTKFGSYVSYPMLSGNASKIYLDTLVSNLTLQGKETTNLIEGNYGSDRSLAVQTGAIVSGHNYIVLTEDKNLNLLQNLYGNVSMGINAKQPLYLYVRSFLSTSKIDFSNIVLRNARIYSAASILDLTLGTQFASGTLVDVQAAGGDVTLHIPKDIGIKLHYKDLVGQVEMIDFVEKEPGYFESTNIASAKSVLEVSIKLGVGRTKILWK